MGKTSIKSKHELSTILPDIVIAGKSNIHLYNWSVFSERNMNTLKFTPWSKWSFKKHSSKGKFFILLGLYKPIQGNCMCHLLSVELVGPTMWSTSYVPFSGWLPCHPPRTWVLDCPTVGVDGGWGWPCGHGGDGCHVFTQKGCDDEVYDEQR